MDEAFSVIDNWYPDFDDIGLIRRIGWTSTPVVGQTIYYITQQNMYGRSYPFASWYWVSVKREEYGEIKRWGEGIFDTWQKAAHDCEAYINQQRVIDNDNPNELVLRGKAALKKLQEKVVWDKDKR